MRKRYHGIRCQTYLTPGASVSKSNGSDLRPPTISCNPEMFTSSDRKSFNPDRKKFRSEHTLSKFQKNFPDLDSTLTWPTVWTADELSPFPSKQWPTHARCEPSRAALKISFGARKRTTLQRRRVRNAECCLVRKTRRSTVPPFPGGTACCRSSHAGSRRTSPVSQANGDWRDGRATASRRQTFVGPTPFFNGLLSIWRISQGGRITAKCCCLRPRGRAVLQRFGAPRHHAYSSSSRTAPRRALRNFATANLGRSFPSA
ncbi:hypothetical protein ACLOJK_007028 [Asimina triloba]